MSRGVVSFLAALVMAASCPPALWGEQAPPSQVTLPLSEYETLRRAAERPSVTVVDTLRLGGSFKGRDLILSFRGRTSGRMATEPVLSGAEGVVLFGCGGEGIVSRGEGATYRITPLSPGFDVRCRVATKGTDRLELTVTRAVLWVESAVADGEFVSGDERGDGGRSFSVVRIATTRREALPPMATGRYRITLRPDETRFRYQIEIHNPNRSRQGIDVLLSSGENVQQVDAEAPYDAQGSHYRFDLPPGESTATLSGTLPGGEFVPPVDASLQYLLLESHPLVRPEVKGERKRVSPGETGLAAEFRGAQAFLITGRERIAWSATRLETLRTTSFAVSAASHVFFLPGEGPALGESAYGLDNQGASDLSLPMQAEPTFASLGGEPVFLTKDAKGDLWLPLSQGAQHLLVQHRQAFRRWPGLGFAALSLPRMSVPATSSSVELRYPADWIAIYESFSSEVRIWLPDEGTVLWGLALAIWTERVLAALGFAARRRAVLAAAVALAGVSSAIIAALVVVAELILTGIVAVPWVRRLGWSAVKVAAAAAAVLVVVWLVSAVTVPMFFRARVPPPPAAAPAASREAQLDYRLTPSAPEAPRRGTKVAEAAGAVVEAYQGLPARFQLPLGVLRTSFSQELLSAEGPLAARVVMLSSTAVAWLRVALVLAAAGLLWSARVDLASGVRGRLQALRTAPDMAGSSSPSA